jgi:predicted enzyme related to lactoylglutathione lyase
MSDAKSKERVTGLGGFFFKASDPKSLARWYEDNLGVPIDPSYGGASFKWREAGDPSREGQTLWTPFAADTKYFEPSRAPFMVNFRVRDLRAMLDQLRAAGVAVDDKVDDTPFGKFGWLLDPDGNRIELWEPNESSD